MSNLLIVEDNADYRELLVSFLENEKYEVTAAENGEAAVELMDKIVFDLIILDLMLPGMDGYEVCRRIREKSEVPVIMLTALDSEIHQMKGYILHIDDYITKPISMPLLMHKVEAVLRRTMPDQPQVVEYRGISLDIKAHTVFVDNIPIEFTLREFEILYELISSPGEVVTRKSLLNGLWGYGYYNDTRIVDTHIKNIRKKLADYDCIETVRGVGYRLKGGGV
ncbi:MAG: response regulator transcription factor [Oscillospiraceae bacterium]|nr:response regulator transcription factor [Oscillospiraceae bacterium]